MRFDEEMETPDVGGSPDPPTSLKARSLRPAMRRFLASERGQALPLFAVMAYFLIQLIFSTFNIGQVVEERIRLQNVADAGAYSTAIWEARTYNLMAFLNRANVANTQTVFFLTTNNAVYKLMTNNSFINTVETNYQVLRTIADVASNIPFIGPVFAAWKVYLQLVIKELYLEGLVKNAYKYFTQVFYEMDDAVGLREGSTSFQALNKFNHAAQIAAAVGASVAMGTDSIAGSIRDEANMNYSSINADTAIVNRALNIYRYLKILDLPTGTPGQEEIDRYKPMLSESREPFTRGQAPPAITLAKPIPDFPSLEIGMKLDFGLSLGHTTQTTFDDDEYRATSSFSYKFTFIFGIGCVPILGCAQDWDFSQTLALPIDETVTTELDEEAIYRFANYQTQDDDYLKEPKTVVVSSVTEQTLKSNRPFLPFSGTAGGYHFTDGLRALGAARTTYIGRLGPDNNPTMFLPYWHARPAQVVGFSSDEGNNKDYDPILTTQAAVSAGFTHAPSALIALEYINFE
jgi:hypothetical protein